MNITLIIFILVYIAMGFGKLPGLKVDRTGAAVIGALALITVGSISAKAAWNTIDYRTIFLLFGLMVVSGAFSVAGFYRWAADKMATLNVTPPVLLAVFIIVSGSLSSILTNDVVVVAMTPLLVSITLARKLNPIPFLLAFCFAANAGSAGTLLGSPQNMIVAQSLQLSFIDLIHVAGLPALLSLPIIWVIIVALYRNKWMLDNRLFSNVRTDSSSTMLSPKVDKRETLKAFIITMVMVILFVINIWPQEIVAVGAAGILLLNRKISSNDVLKEVDGDLLLLIMGLFVVNAAMATTGLTQTLLAELKHLGLDLNHPLSLFFTSAALSNIVGNNPAVMLLTPYLDAHINADSLGAALVLGTGFSSNMIVFGSLAGIIAVEQAKSNGITISFFSFLKAGFPVAVSCLIMSAFWILWL